MMRRTYAATGAALLVGACSGDIQENDTSWNLTANATGALVDEGHPEFGLYPNPSEFASLKVTLSPRGELCGEAPTGERFCGGPLDGIPYVARMVVKNAQACVTVADIYGHGVAERCGVRALSGSAEGESLSDGTCYQAVRDDGSACEICASDEGQVTRNTCDENAEDDGSSGGGSGNGNVCDSYESAFVAGFDAMLSAANEGLQSMGLVGVYITPPDDVAAYAPDEDRGDRVRALCQWAENGPRRGEGSRNYVYGEAAIDECVNEGRCRVAQMLRLATIEACQALTDDCRRGAQEVGIVKAGIFVLDQLCSDEPMDPPNHDGDDDDHDDGDDDDHDGDEGGRCDGDDDHDDGSNGGGDGNNGDDGSDGDGDGGNNGDDGSDGDGSAGDGSDDPPPPVLLDIRNGDRPFECRGSPLVIDTAGDGLSLRGPVAERTFELLPGMTLASGWLAGSDDAFVALDRDGNGQIDGGTELFGEASDGFAADGFMALARLDDNLDGVLDAQDAAFSQLLLWRDDGDARSSEGELSPLASSVSAISLSSRKLGTLDTFGNELGLTGDVQMVDGSSRAVTDVWFRFSGR